MLELERLGVRVVSGRLGRKAGDEDEPGVPGVPGGDKKTGVPGGVAGLGGAPPAERSNSMGWGADGDLNRLMERRTSMGLSFPADGRRGSLGSLGQVVGLEDAGLGGGFSMGDAQRRASSLGLGSLAGGGIGGMGMSVNPNQHYEMLKLHHMNLLNEIQETTLMMNLYQQQQLQQQQQQLQQQQDGMGGADQMGALMGQGGMDAMFGTGQLSQQQRASLGLGSNFGSPGTMAGMMQQQLQVPQGQGQPQPQQQQQSPAAMPNQQQTPKPKDATTPQSEGESKTEDAAAPSSEAKRPAEDDAAEGSANKKPKTEDEGEKDEGESKDVKVKEEGEKAS